MYIDTIHSTTLYCYSLYHIGSIYYSTVYCIFYPTKPPSESSGMEPMDFERVARSSLQFDPCGEPLNSPKHPKPKFISIEDPLDNLDTSDRNGRTFWVVPKPQRTC